MFYKIEMTETVVRGMTVYVEADSEEEAREEASHESCWLDEETDDPHDTVAREIDSVAELTAEEMDTVDFLTQCQECGVYALLTCGGESKSAPGCECASDEDNDDDRETRLSRRKGDRADACPPKLPNDFPPGRDHG